MTRPPDALPTLEQYLAGLPNGWSSYPSCRASGSLIATAVRRDGLDRVAVLPAPLASIGNVSAADEVPEVLYVGVLLTILDGVFEADRERFLTWSTEMSAQRMLSMDFGPLRGQNAERLIAEFPQIWGTFHRGTSLRVAAVGNGAACMVLEYPAGLFPAVFLEYFARSVAVALIRVDAAQPAVSVTTIEGDHLDHATLSASWTPARGVRDTDEPGSA